MIFGKTATKTLRALTLTAVVVAAAISAATGTAYAQHHGGGFHGGGFHGGGWHGKAGTAAGDIMAAGVGVSGLARWPAPTRITTIPTPTIHTPITAAAPYDPYGYGYGY
jgi:hypothetical protein